MEPATLNNSALRTIRILSDGRPGHVNQSAGLASALARRTGAEIQTIQLPEARLKWPLRFSCATALDPGARTPDLIIGTGHRTHLPMVWAARRFGARSVVIMRPTWPVRWFDLCLAATHDALDGCSSGNVALTRGALNRIPEIIPAKEARGVILIGGPSKHFGWNPAPLIEAIEAVVATRRELQWVVGDSRRTPPEFLETLRSRGIAAEFVPHATTTPEWVPAQMLAARDIWVTEESVSMLHEAVTAQARTGLLPMPVRKHGSRLIESVRGLVADGFATPFETWQRNGSELPQPRPLHETARCAEMILKRFYAGQPGPGSNA